MTPDRRTLLAIFSLAFGLRILYAVLVGSSPELLPVQETYDFRVAARIAAGLNWIATPFSPNAPGYLLTLAAAFGVLGTAWWTAVLLNAALGAVTALFLYRIGEKRIGRHFGLVAALWLATSIHPMHFASIAMRDVMTTFLFVWFVYSLVKPFHRMRGAVGSAVLYALLIYTEPRFLVLLPLVIVFLALWSTHHRALSAQYVFLFMTALLFLSLPWTARNYIVRRELVPISLEAQRYTAPVARLLLETPPPPAPGPEAVVVKRPGFVHNWSEFWRAVRVRDFAGDPARGLAPELAWSRRHNAVSLLNYGILLPFLVVGVVGAVRRRHRAALVMSGATLAYAIVCGWYGGSDRARLPVEPLIVLVAMYGIWVLLDKRRAAGDAEAT